MPDFAWTHHGSVIILTALSEAGQNWITEHLPDDAPSWGGGIVIEPRFFDDIADGIINDGLELN
jgi:hypothetical protein